MRLFLLLSFLLVTINSALSQVPGYQGKRFFIEAGISLFPNLGAATAQNLGPRTFPNESPSGHFTMKDYYSFSCHYVIGRKINFKAGYNYQVAGLSTDIQTPSLYYPGYYDYRNLFYQLHIHDANFSFELYHRKIGNLAPLGFYGSPGIRLVFVEDVLRDQMVNYADQRANHNAILNQLSILPENPTVFMFGITGSIGYRTILFHRITLNIAFEMTIFPQHFFVSANFPGVSSITTYDRGALNTVADRYLFGVHIGIGALLF